MSKLLSNKLVSLWLGRGLLVLALWVAVQFVTQLVARLKPRSFAILYPENGGLYALGFLLGAVVLVLLLSYVGKLWGQRGGRIINYWEVVTDQLTHVFIWLVILFTLYPIIYVVSASVDSTNSLVSGSLGPDTEPLLVRARVLPSTQGKDFGHYHNLFSGVHLYQSQWLMLIAVGVALLGLVLLWFLTQRDGGTASPNLRRARGFTTWLGVAGLALFFLTLSQSQFVGFATGSQFLLWLRNSFIISTLAGIMAVVLVTTAGYAMARLRFPGRFQTLMFFIFIQMFPGFLAIVAITQLVYALGLTNNFFGLILAYSGGVISFNTWIYKGYVESLPASLEEAAMVDGCTPWTAFTRIVLPLSGPMLVFIFINQFIGTYSEFFLSNILLTGGDKWNVGLGLRSIAPKGFDTQYFGVFAAAAVVGSLPIVALYYSFQQIFIGGALAGGVKE